MVVSYFDGVIVGLDAVRVYYDVDEDIVQFIVLLAVGWLLVECL